MIPAGLEREREWGGLFHARRFFGFLCKLSPEEAGKYLLVPAWVKITVRS